MMCFKTFASLLFCLLFVKTAVAQLTVNVAAGGDVVGASYQVLQAGGGTINLAAGTYFISGSIIMGPNTTINGAGGPGSATQSVIYAPASPNGIAMVTQAYAGAPNLNLSNLVLDGNIPQAAMLYGTGNGNYAYNNTGIYFYDQSATTVGVTLTNIEVRHTLRGILTGLVDNLTISGCYFHDNNPGGFSHNMYLVATSGVEIDHTRSDNALTGDGLHIDFGGFFYTIRKSEFSGNNGLGILSQQDNSVTVEDSKIDFNTNDGIQIDAGGLLLTRDQMNHNGGYGFNIPDTADGNGQVNGVYTLGDGATDYFYQASINDFTIYGPPSNVYPAIQADGVIGVVDTADWTLNYPGYTYMGAVDFNANHLTDGSITFPYVGATVEGTPGSGTGNYPLVFRYSNGTSSAQTMNVSVNGGAPVAVSFPSTGSYSTWNTVTMNGILNVGNSTVTMSVPTGATSAPEIDTLTVTTPTPNAPNAPTNLTGTAPTPYSVTLNWIAPSAGNNNAAQTYTVYRNGGLIAANVVGTTYTDTRIFYGESTNSYFVVAANQGGTSGGSNTITVTTGIDAPPGLQVSVSPGVPSNNLNWLGVSGAANYLVKRSTVSGGPYQTVATIPATTGFPSYSDTSLALGTNYFYVIAAVDASGNVSANSYQVKALSETFTLSASASSVNLSSITPDTISVVGTNGFSDAVNFAVAGLPTGVMASLSTTSGSSTQITFTANTSAAQGSYPVTVTGTDGALSSSIGVTVVVSSGQLAQVITFNPIPQQAVGNSLAVYATASSGLPVTFSVVPNGNCSVSGNVVSFLNGGACGVLATQAGNANFSAAAQVGQVVQVGAPVGQTITFNTIPTQNPGTTLTLTAVSSSGLPVSYASSTQSVCTVSGSTATLSAIGTCMITASQAGAGQYGPAVSVTQSFVVAPLVPTDLTSARFAPNCGAANVTQIFPDGFLASGQAGVNNLQVVSDPDVVLIGNQWWLIFASNPGPTRGIEPVAAYLPPGVSLSHTGIYPADPNGWHLVGANAQGTGKGVAIDGNVSPAGWDTIAAETPSIDVGPDGTVSVYYAGHNLGQTNFEIGLMNNVVNGVATSIDPVPAMVATQPWEFDNGLGAILEQSVRWEPELNKFIMYYTAKGWWDNPPSNDIAYAESTDGITWTNRQHLGFPVSYYNQDFLFNPQWNRYEMVVANDPTGVGGASGRDLVWLDSAGPGTSFSAWQNQVTLLDHTSPGTPAWRDQGLLSPAVKYGNLPGEENRIYVFFHAYGSADPMSIARFYCDAITPDPGYTMTSGAPFMNLAPSASATMPITVNPTNGFAGTVNFTVSGAPAGVSTSLSQSASTTGTTLSVTVGANTAQGRYPITVTGTSGALTREATFTLNVSGLSQTITIQPLFPNNIAYAPGLTYTINASASSGLPVTLSVGGNGTLNGNVLTVIGGGDIIIAANQAGNGTYSPAPQVTTTLVVAPQVQTVNVASIPPQTVGGALDLSKYVSATSGLIVDSYTNQTPTICTNNGSLLTFTNVGQCVILAIQFGNQFYAPAGAAATITVNQATQTITFPAIVSQPAGGTLIPSATASSGLPVSFTVGTNGNCSISGRTVTFLHVGSCSIVANQAGSANYLAAAQTVQVVTVVPGNPTIVFTIPDTHTINSPIILSPTSNSTGPFTFGVVSGPASDPNQSSTLTLTGGGPVTVLALQNTSTDFNVGVVTTTFNSIAGSVWLGNAGSLSTLDLTGVLISPANGFTGGGLGATAGAQAMAFDSTGSLWVANQGGGISKFNSNGSVATGSPFSAAGLNSPAALAVDGNSQVWVANANGNVTALSSAGNVVSTTTDGSISGATGIAVDSSGSVWVSNGTTNTVDEIVGVAAPTAPPANALQNGTVGVKP